MKTLGLTGSIGMGKSVTAAMFKDAGVPVYDADAAVHDLYEKDGAAVLPLSKRFDGIVKDGAIDRSALRKQVLLDKSNMSDLEAIVHPLVGQAQRTFIKRAEASDAKLAVLDIPLLFETGGNKRCDYTLVVSAPEAVQRTRVLARDGMTVDAFEAILAKQMPDADKRFMADFIISTAFGFDFTRACVQAIVSLFSNPAEGVDL